MTSESSHAAAGTIDRRPRPTDGSRGHGPGGVSASFAFVVGVVAFLIFLPGLFWGLPGGKSIAGALQILDGQVPYRDFWTMYAPGEFYLTAAVFAVFGQEVLYQGVVAVLIRAGAISALFVLLRTLGVSRWWAALVAMVFTFGLWSPSPTIISYHPALLLLLVSLTLVVRYYRYGEPSRLVWAGVWAGLAATFKHDVSFYVMVATTVGLFASWAVLGSRRPAHWVAPWWATLRLFLGTMVFFLPIASWIVWKAGPDVWHDLIVFPATDFAGVRGESYEPLTPRTWAFRQWLQSPSDLGMALMAAGAFSLWIVCYFPIYIGLAAAAILAVFRKTLGAVHMAVAFTGLAALPFFLAAANVQKNTHLDSMALMSFLIVLSLWKGGRAHLTPTARRRVRRVIMAGGAVYALAVVTPFVMRAARIAEDLPGLALELDGVRGTRIPADRYEFIHPIATFLRENTRPDERIYVGVARHEAIIINEPSFYYLADRLSCCRYSELHPGITDRREVQEEIIGDMERHDVRALVIWDFGWSDERLDQIVAEKVAAVPGTDATLLNEYIEANFETVLTRGQHRVLWRRGAPGP